MHEDNAEFYESALRFASAYASAARIDGVVDRDDIAQETMVRLLSMPRVRAAGEDPRPGAADRIPKALIATVAHGKVVDEYRRSAVRPSTSVEDLTDRGAAAALGASVADDPAERLVRWEQAREEVMPMLRLRDQLCRQRGKEEGELVYNGLRDGVQHREIVEEVRAAHPETRLSEAGLRKVVERAKKADPRLLRWLERREPPHRASSARKSRTGRPAR